MIIIQMMLVRESPRKRGHHEQFSMDDYSGSRSYPLTYTSLVAAGVSGALLFGREWLRQKRSRSQRPLSLPSGRGDDDDDDDFHFDFPFFGSR